VTETSPRSPKAFCLAAVDLGSNSFHLNITRVDHDQICPIHTLSERVQLGEETDSGALTPAAIGRGLACLKQFRQLLDETGPYPTRVVGTHALRRAKNRSDFITPAEALLGTPIEILHGEEEARLIYTGVAQTLSDKQTPHLVIDVGGGSTEFILGCDAKPLRLESLPLGCVSYGEAFFSGGDITAARFDAARQQASHAVSALYPSFSHAPWQETIGASGTLIALERIIVAAGWRTSGIDRASLSALRQKLLSFHRVGNIDLAGLSAHRKAVVTAGLAITQGIFDGLRLESMNTSTSALREGVIHELLTQNS
jgi:exopolyphosphatase/guanosine-5'-triphosphate,3'-diphosphate pyrophosphatase